MSNLVKHENMISSPEAFNQVYKMAQTLSASTMIPKQYQGNIADSMLAIEMSQRMGLNPLTVMQNLDIIHGKPGWSSKFITSLVNTSGRYGSNLMFEYGKEGTVKHNSKDVENLTCTAYTFNHEGEKIEGEKITIAMAIAEGWYGKNGSKWPNMPKLMLTYRAASFFAKMHCPEVLNGLQSSEEMQDITPAVEDQHAEIIPNDEIIM